MSTPFGNPLPQSFAAQPPFINVTGSAVTITAAVHAGAVVTLNRAAGIAVTLPAATGTGNVYTFFVGTTITSNTTVFTATTTSLNGVCLMCKASTTLTPFLTSTSTTITLNGTTQGGILGDWIQLIDVGTNVWALLMIVSGTGTVATPFA